MVGIYGVINGDDAIFYLDKELYDSFENSHPNFKVQLKSYKGTDNYGIFEADDFTILYYGNVFQGDYKIGIDKLVSLYIEWQEDVIHHIHGEFNLVLFNKPKNMCSIFVDSSGVLPLYYKKCGNTIVFSNSFPFVADSCAGVNTLNLKAVHNILRFGSTLSNDTLMSNIYSLKGGDLININLETYEMVFSNHNSIEYNEIYNEAFHIEQVQDVLRKAIIRRLHVDRVGVTLSGGLDSRLMIYLLHQEKQKQAFDLKAFTWGQSYSEEQLIAKEVADILGVELLSIELTPENFLENRNEYSRLTGGMDIIFQSYLLDVGKRIARDVRVIFTGFTLDVLLGGTFINEELLYSNDIDFKNNFNKYEKMLKLNVFSEEELIGGLRPQFQSLVKEHHQDYINEVMKIETERVGNKVKESSFMNRDLNMVLFRNTIPAQFCEHVYPNTDIDFMKAIRQIPLEYKLDHKFYRKLLMTVSNEMADIKYHNTGLPVSVPTSYWSEGRAIEAKNEALIDNLFKETGIDFPYRHYYSNFNQWSRSNEYWTSLIKDMLLSEESIVSNQFFKYDYVSRIVQENFRWERNNQRKISYLLTLESFFRTYKISL